MTNWNAKRTAPAYSDMVPNDLYLFPDLKIYEAFSIFAIFLIHIVDRNRVLTV